MFLCVWVLVLRYPPVRELFLLISGQYLCKPQSLVQKTTSGAPEQKPNSSFPNIYQKLSEPEYRQYRIIIYHEQSLASQIIPGLCHAHSSSVSLSLTQCPPTLTPPPPDEQMSFCVKLYLSVPISGGGCAPGGELLLHNLQPGPTMVYQVFTPHSTPGPTPKTTWSGLTTGM